MLQYVILQLKEIMEEKEEDREEKGMKEKENEISGDWTGETGGTVIDIQVELQRGTNILTVDY